MNLRRNIEKVYEFRSVPQSQNMSSSTLGIVSKAKKKKKERERERDYLTFREEIINKVPGQEIRDRHIDKKEQ